MTHPTATLDGDRFTLVLPFPSAKEAKALNPHAKGNWRPRHKATKAQKATAEFLTRTALPPGHTPWTRATIDYGFYWPDRIGRDFYNYCQRFKGAVDGIVRAGLIVDDKWTVLEPGSNPVSALDRERPRVEIVIERATA